MSKLVNFPDFFCIGAQKSGTTTLHEWLTQSEEVGLPWTKETHFFRDEERFSKGQNWYFQQFKDTSLRTKIFGEVDPEYMYFPECSERISSTCDAPKLIIVLREPISRALSHYRMSQRRGYETLTFHDALFEETSRLQNGDRFSKIHHSYIDRGLYAKQIEKIMYQLPKSRLLVLKFEDLYASQDSSVKALNLICDFIGISSNGITCDVSVKHNEAAVPRFVFLRDIIYGQGKLKKSVNRLISSRELKIRIMKFFDRLNTKTLDNNSSLLKVDHCPDFVYEMFINDLCKLQSMVDVDVSHWIANYQSYLKKK